MFQKNNKLKVCVVFVFMALVLMVGRSEAQFSFISIDSFEDGTTGKWYKFGNVGMTIENNPTSEAEDTVTESCGEFSLRLKGGTTNWFVGGIGTDLGIDAAPYSRLQIDMYGSETGGKVKIELFDDDNGNAVLEQDPSKDWVPTNDDKWVAEIPILSKGWSRYSIPFTAFKLENPGCGDGIWNPDQKDGSGGLLKIQVSLIAGEEKGKVDVALDNLILTY